MLLASLAFAAAVSATHPPAVGTLAFGSSPASARSVLGKESGTDQLDDFTWRSYMLGRTLVRVAYYHDRVSQFAIVPDAPLTVAQARGWAKAFMPGLDRGREVAQDASHELIFGTFIMQGRPFEAQVHLDLGGTTVSGLGGEIHWLD
ncbi:MAG: hypothetical protein JWM80_5140 [Cyanobacteria bacterium RYN_339]|nr:hypothetical protein [Cyanobacteria bacterium RYN_339]